MTITINNVGVSPGNVGLTTGNANIRPIDVGIVKAVTYTSSNNSNVTVTLADPDPATFIPLENVTNDMIIGWVNAIVANTSANIGAN